MSIFTEATTLTADIFLQQYWQKKSLFLPGAIDQLIGVVDVSDLMAIACEEDGEARIIKGFGMNGPWSCEQGPFQGAYLESMPEKNWTLLVQGVDQWLEEVNAIMGLFSFLPKWRLEDIMASFAPVGGGVGPHFDYYDVFLLQVSGTREWKLGQMCSDASALQDNSQVKLLDEFITEQSMEAKPGDMLYVPAGIAHWGTAVSDDCITLSIGFRAPSQKEILLATLESLIEDVAQLSDENKRYRDKVTVFGNSSIDENTFRVNAVVEAQLSSLAQKLTPQTIQQAMNKSFGELVTEPRYLPPLDNGESDGGEREWQELLSLEAINHLINDGGLALLQPVYSRFAFSDTLLFVNGASFSVGQTFAREVCDSLLVTPIDKAEKDVLLTLLESGDIELDVDE